uniref:Uncharacterized protein n=1 Tax=viral metagenome TaxID=1070528 RepID=A0A6C0DZS1_9ZZZZ
MNKASSFNVKILINDFINKFEEIKKSNISHIKLFFINF